MENNGIGKWQKNTLTWRYIHNNTYENCERLGEGNIRKTLKKAMAAWEATTNIEFIEAISSAEPDVVIKFATGQHGDGWDFGKRVIAHAFYPSENKIGLAGDIHFNDAVEFTIDKKENKMRRSDGRLYMSLVKRLD